MVQEGVQALATHMDERFDRVYSDMTREFGKVRAEMATKDFVDRKFETLDGKVNTLVNVLEKKQVLTALEAVDVIHT